MNRKCPFWALTSKGSIPMRTGKYIPFLLIGIILVLQFCIYKKKTKIFYLQVGVILKSYVGKIYCVLCNKSFWHFLLLDQSFDQLKLLNEKLTYLKSKYRQLTGLGLGHNNVVTDHSAIPKCFPKKQVAFAKTHKTGSSTLQNIFFR